MRYIDQMPLPSLKVYGHADTSTPTDPIVILSGRDLVGMPHAVALTEEEAADIGRQLLSIAASFKATREASRATEEGSSSV